MAKEVEGVLRSAPFWLLRLAKMRLPVDCREELHEEWYAELFAALHDKGEQPLSRLLLGLRFSIGLLFAARRIAREMPHARIKGRRSARRRGDLRQPLWGDTSRFAGGIYKVELLPGVITPLYVRRFGTGYDRQEVMTYFVALQEKLRRRGHLSVADLRPPKFTLARYGFEELSVESAVHLLEQRIQQGPFPAGFLKCTCDIERYPCKAQRHWGTGAHEFFV